MGVDDAVDLRWRQITALIDATLKQVRAKEDDPLLLERVREIQRLAQGLHGAWETATFAPSRHNEPPKPQPMPEPASRTGWQLLARLGNVAFWLSLIIAGGWLWMGYDDFATRVNPHSFNNADFVTLAIVPVISLSVGWATRYILAGR